MKTMSIAPETIISGFSHFLWLTMLSLLCAQVDIPTVVKSLSQISVGATILLAPILFGASHFLGTLANRICSDIISLVNKLRNKQPDLIGLYEGREKNKETALACDMSWRTKSFFLSMAFAIIMIVIMSIWLDYTITSGKECLIILTIGIILDALTIIAVFTQNRHFRKLQEAVKKP